MPVEFHNRRSLGYKDINMSFKRNPLTDDIVVLKNENAIAQAVKNLVLTAVGERFYKPTLGSELASLLFENLDPVTASQIQSFVENLIEVFEPRVALKRTTVSPDIDNNAYAISIEYQIVEDNLPIQVLQFPLTKTR